MLAVARGVLMRVHQGVFEALAAPPVQAPNGTLVYGNWDVRHVLQQARRQVHVAASACVAGRLILQKWCPLLAEHLLQEPGMAADRSLPSPHVTPMLRCWEESGFGRHEDWWSRQPSVQVLAGVRIVFSRVIPLDQPPQQHELWKRAEQFGATCSERADASVTHVISKALGTQKVHAPSDQLALSCCS